jgi:superfamily I DNA/RNA helicase
LPDENLDAFLDDEQRDAVEAREPAIAVLAGPGSGKTRVLSYRARHLLANDPGSKALLMTFTNKAAAEMKSRAFDVAVVTTDRVVASTYHSFAVRLLRAHGNLVDVADDFEVLDEEGQEQLARSAAEHANTADRSTRWMYLRLRRLQPREDEVIRFADVYQALKRQENVLDFDDLLVYAADLLESNAEVAQAIGNAHRHILIDEFQDTNPAQFAAVRALWAHAQTVSVFADDDQGIYQFAGAEPANIRRFVQELDAKTYPLNTNYRCRSNIVRKANRLISADEDASGRQMRSHYEGGEVRSRPFRDTRGEAEIVGAEIQALVEDGVRPSDIAVLGRRRSRLRAIIEQLEDRGVAVSNWLGAAFEADERKALTTALYVVRASLTDRQAARLCDLLGVDIVDETHPDEMLRQIGDHVPAAAPLLELRELVWGGAEPLEVLDQATEALMLVDESFGQGLVTLREAVEAFQAHDPEFGIDHLIAELALGGIQGPPTIGGGVKVASLHRTKGLQWRYVYLLGMEEGTLPDYHAVTPLEICEERRTCFVGVCRAEEFLTLSRVHVLNGWAKQPSRFLTEMGFNPTE